MKIELTDRQRAARAEYLKRWREENREKRQRSEAARWDRIADQYEAEAKAGGRPFKAPTADR